MIELRYDTRSSLLVKMTSKGRENYFATGWKNTTFNIHINH